MRIAAAKRTGIDLGRHFIVGLGSTVLGELEAELLQSLQPLGIILFAHNVDLNGGPEWPRKFIELIDAARKAIGRSSLLVSIDHEGGRVHRLRPPVTHFPAAKFWGENAGAVGRAMGRELAALSINLNFAPDADVLTEKKNEVIGDRALGTSAAEVSRRALSFLEGMELEGVLGCAKHFPGHGATLADSHLSLPTFEADRELLFNRDVVPFKTLIEKGLSLIMTAHVLYPAIDQSLPATLSPSILSELLRGTLGYQNAVITDALEMRALSSFSPVSRAKSILEAGADILLIAKPPDPLPVREAIDVANGLYSELEKGGLNHNCLVESAKRIDSLTQKIVELEGRRNPKPELTVLGCSEHASLSQSLRAD